MVFYISKFRYKMGFAFLVGIVIMIINGKIMGMSFGRIFIDYGITFLVLLILGVYLWYPAFKYDSAEADELWAKWGKSAQCKKFELDEFEFDRVYEKTKYAMAKEPGKGYRTLTTLENCTCVEFRKNRTPCKHMYKLAEILNLYKK